MSRKMFDFEGVRNQAQISGSTLTEAGKNWLTIATDPNHDTPVPLVGLPDQDTSDVVIQCHKQSFNLSAPAGTTGNWAAHVFAMPFLRTSSFKFGDTFRGGVKPATSLGTTTPVQQVEWTQATESTAGAELGPLNVWAWSNDAPILAPRVEPAKDKSFVPPQLIKAIGGRDDMRTRGRIIAMGFEATNTTAPLNKQGLATSYRIPAVQRKQVQMFNERFASLNGTGPANFCIGPNPSFGTVLGAPPDTVDTAMAYPGTVQWPAERGIYTVCRFNQSENVMDAPERRAFQCAHADHPATALAVAETPSLFTATKMYSPQFENVSVDNGVWIDDFFSDSSSLQQFTPMDISGTMFTGLSKETTLTINVTIYYEFAPHVGDLGFSAMAYSLTRSPAYDPLALLMYQLVASQLPTSVPQDMNPAGEYWDKVIGLIRRVLPAVQAGALAMGHPGVAAAAHLATKVIGSKPQQASPAPAKKLKKK